MTKNGFIEKLAVQCGLSQDTVSAVVNGGIRLLIDTLLEGEKITLTGFGSFTLKEREAQTMRRYDMQTGENREIRVPQRQTIAFKQARYLFDRERPET
ncbi:MAG: HU family DNA-binding protein [Oscillospiraceae bacterium]|nr:HU family DNA-binding protein [Oscillospiraceae bacterium]